MVVDASDDLELGAIGQKDPAHDVELPQLPAFVVGFASASAFGFDKVVSHQLRDRCSSATAVVDAAPLEFVEKRCRPPVRVQPAQLADRGLDSGADLVGT